MWSDRASSSAVFSRLFSVPHRLCGGQPVSFSSFRWPTACRGTPVDRQILFDSRILRQFLSFNCTIVESYMYFMERSTPARRLGFAFVCLLVIMLGPIVLSGLQLDRLERHVINDDVVTVFKCPWPSNTVDVLWVRFPIADYLFRGWELPGLSQKLAVYHDADSASVTVLNDSTIVVMSWLHAWAKEDSLLTRGPQAPDTIWLRWKDEHIVDWWHT